MDWQKSAHQNHKMAIALSFLYAKIIEYVNFATVKWRYLFIYCDIL